MKLVAIGGAFLAAGLLSYLLLASRAVQVGPCTDTGRCHLSSQRFSCESGWNFLPCSARRQTAVAKLAGCNIWLFRRLF
jgi:hypothetical protein